jgi:hypothetical protein
VAHNDLDHRLHELLLAADRSRPAPRVRPPGLAAIRARYASKAARRHLIAGLAAAIALFAVIARPAIAPVTADRPSTDSDASAIASLEREADLIRLMAMSELGRRDQLQTLRSGELAAAAQNAAALRTAAAEKAAFIMYCEADRLSQEHETLNAARARYAAVAELFPKTIWARMAAEHIAPPIPIEKG